MGLWSYGNCGFGVWDERNGTGSKTRSQTVLSEQKDPSLSFVSLPVSGRRAKSEIMVTPLPRFMLAGRNRHCQFGPKEPVSG
jgi:hypothetical protein